MHTDKDMHVDVKLTKVLNENRVLKLIDMALCQIVLIEVNYNLIIGLSIKLLCTSLMLFL